MYHVKITKEDIPIVDMDVIGIIASLAMGDGGPTQSLATMEGSMADAITLLMGVEEAVEALTADDPGLMVAYALCRDMDKTSIDISHLIRAKIDKARREKQKGETE